MVLLCFENFSSKTDPECSVPHPKLTVNRGSIMEIQIMLIEMKFYSANVYFTLLCGEVQSGSEGADNVLFICKMLRRICGLGYFKRAT